MVELNGTYNSTIAQEIPVSTNELKSILGLHTHMIKMIAKGDSLHAILGELTLRLEEHFKRKTYCTLLLLVDGNRLSVEHAPKLPIEYQKTIHLINTGPTVGSCGTAVHLKETVIVSDIENNPLWDDFRLDALRFGLKACWSSPILIDQRVVGTFAVYHPEVCTPALHEIDMLETCANLAGFAIERDQRIKLEMQLQATHQEMEHLLENHQGMIYKYKKVNDAFIHTFGGGQLMERLGLRPEDCVGKSLSEIVNLEFSYQKEIHYEHAWNGQVTGFEGDLNGVHYIAKLNPVLRDGKVAEVIVSCNDITELKKTHEELRETKELLESFVNNTADAIATMNVNGKISYVNQAYVDLFGWQEEELLGREVPNVPELYKKEFSHNTLTTLSENEVIRVVTQRQSKAGRIIPVSVTQSPTKDRNGKVNGASAIIRDITEQKRIERELEENRQSYQSLFYASPDMVFSMDLNGVLLNANQSFLRILGYTAEQVKGMHYENFVEESTISNTKHYFELALRGNSQTYENVSIHKNGHHVMLQTTNIPIVVNDKIVGVHGIAKDITERKQAQKKILQLKQQMELVLNSVGDGIYVMDVDLKIKLINAAGAKLCDYEVNELIGKKDTFRYYDELEFCAPCQTLQDGNIRYVTDALFYRKDGSNFPAEYIASPIWENGTISGVVVTFRDTSEKKLAEEYLLKSAKLDMAGQLAAGVAHEIRNPLTSIQGFIQLMEGSDKIDPEYFSIIKLEFERIEGIIGDFLALAKPQAVNFLENDVGLILEQTIRLMTSQATMQGIEVVSMIDSSLPRIQCDKHQLKQVFINVIKNAIEATKAKGQLEITCKATASHLHITFLDQGAGIPKERIQHLFEPFYSTKEKGTGLGLMICYKIIEEHKGTMWIESEEGKGTAVQILIPLAVRK